MREQKKCKKTNENAITLIALIISIIIMLILAGVSINAIVGDNGIITQAINAKTLTELASEKEEIQYIVIEGYSGDVSIGTPLYDKTLANGNIWNIVVINDTQEVYGTGWYYIDSGTDIGDYGETKYGWLVNYETGEIVQLEEDNYTQLDYSSSLAVTDNLILNIDSGVIEDSDDSLSTAEQIANVEEQLGDNITLIGFDEEDWGEASGITSTSFNFDGVDDYIQIQYNDEEEKEALAENGFTFEFYGIMNFGSGYDYYNGGEATDQYGGLFSYRIGETKLEGSGIRFGFQIESGQVNLDLKWNAGYGPYDSDFSEYSLYRGAIWNIHYVNAVELGVCHFYTITLDCSSSYVGDDGETMYFKQCCYVDGEILYEGNYSVLEWEYFVNDLSSYDIITIGVSNMGTAWKWYYSNLEAYTLRLYSRGLSEEEVLENYNTSVAYHTLLENMNENS